ncbi:diaminopimelate decarboxylase family protein [Rhodoferax sp. UBA5149]|uniref:diaminopimelate decarboxylase family protein n=1 Tax=Rhodoferax sp. UBA5149 TaxID=1947379 RepID=UPI0025D144EC|nr:hypothetical protein [Rhodoferax sp. UBA5149]
MPPVSDDAISVHNGRLHFDGCDTVALAEEFGTPLFVTSENKLRQNIRRFHQAFAAQWTEGEVQILPAIKSNWNLAICTILASEGTGADTYSAGELEASLSAGIAPERISVNGGGKSEETIRRCIEAGVRITIEDLDEPDLIERVAMELGKKAYVRFRVKPDFPNLWKLSDFALDYASIATSIQFYKSGIPAQYLVELGRKVLRMTHVELVGFHFHGGRHHASLWYWRGTMRQYARLIGHLCRAWGGYQPKEIDIGGGFACPRDPHSKLHARADVTLTWWAWRPFELISPLLGAWLRNGISSLVFNQVMARGPSQARAPSYEDYAKTAVGALRDELHKQGVTTTGVCLQIEPGRGLFGDTGIHITRVKKFKQQTEPVKLNWVLTDTSVFFLTGGVYENNYHDFRIANRADAPATVVAEIVGHSCYGDRILPLTKIPAVVPGDLIALLDTGAYQEVSASNFNALPRPGMVLINGKRRQFIRRPETTEDVFARDRIPDWLASPKQEVLA